MSDLDKDKAELKRLTREAHEATQDLKSVIREARGVVLEIRKAASVAVNERIEPVVIAQIAALGEATQVAISEAEDRIENRFNQLASVMLGEDRKSIREGRPTIPQMAENIGALRQGKELPHDIDGS